MENNLFFASDLLDSADDIHQQDQFGAVEHKTDSHQSKYSRKNLLISWVNSLESQSCLLASDLDDFKNGVIFCHIVNEIILKNRKPRFQAQINAFNPTNQDIVNNFHISLTEIKENCQGIIPPLLQNATAFDFMQNDDMIITLLDFLYSVSQNQTKMEETLLARTVPPRRPDSTDINNENTVKKTIQPSESYDHITKPFALNSPIGRESQPGQNQPPQLYSNRQKPPLLPAGGPRDKMPGYSANKFTSPSHSASNFHNPSSNESDTNKFTNPLQEYTASIKASPYKPENGGYKYHTNLSPKLSEAGNSILINDFLDPDQNTPSYQLHPSSSLKPTKEATGGNAYQYQPLPFNKPGLHQPSPISKPGQQSPFTLKWTPDEKTGRKNGLSDVIGDLEYVSPTQAAHHRSQSNRNYISDGLHKQNQMLNNPHSQSQPVTERKQQSFSRNLTFDQPENQDPRGFTSDRNTASTKSPYRPTQHSVIVQNTDLNNISQTKREHMPGFKQQSAYEAIPLNPAPTISYRQDYPEQNTSFRKTSSQKLISTKERRSSQESQERKRPPVVITPVDSTLKKKVLEWLFSITFLKESARGLESKLPRICRNGVIFIDLINRLEGKHDTVKGVTRHPQSKTQINVNYSKVLSYLRTIEKMNPRYLWAQDCLMEGNDDVFWGFLFDIWCLYSHKISPYDPRYQDLQNKKIYPDLRAKTTEADQTTEGIDEDAYEKYLYTNYRDTSRMISRSSLSPNADRSISRTRDYSAIYVDNPLEKSSHPVKSPFKRAQSPMEAEQSGVMDNEKRSRNRTSQYARIHRTESQGQASISPKLSHRVQTSQSPRDNFGNLSMRKQSQKTLEDANNTRSKREITPSVDIQEVEAWLKQMGFKSYFMRKDRPLLEDPFRNGVLLMHVVTRVENEKTPAFYSKPETIDQCRTNVYNAFGILRRKKTPIPLSCSRSEEQVLQGNSNTIWVLFQSLMRRAQDRGYKGGSIYASYSPMKSVHQEHSGNILPYSEDQIKRLEDSMVHWIARVGLFDDVRRTPATFEELEVQLRSGTLLCDLISLVTQTSLPGVVKKPTTEHQFIENIRKGLEILRVNRNMGQRFTWKERELYAGSKHYLLGFLEDLHRLFDGLPPRVNPNYYQSGPYYGDKDDHAFVQEEEKPEEVPKHEGIQTKKLVTFPSRTLTQSDSGRDIAPKKTMSYGKALFESQRSFPAAGETQTTANFTVDPRNVNPDEPISLLNLQQKPVNLVDFSSFSGIKEPVDTSMPQRGTKETRWHSTERSRSDYKPLDTSAQRNDISTMSTSRRVIGQMPLSHQRTTSMTLRMQDSDDVTDIIDWLYFLDLGTIAEEINFAAEEIPEFTDGIALCQIVEKLEIKEIPSVNLKPKTKASKLVNIRKALQILSAKQEIDPKIVNREDDILEGKGVTIRALLRNIKKAYRYMAKTLNASRSQISGIGGSGKKSIERSRNMTTLHDEFHVFNPYENYVLSAEERRKIIVSPKKAAD